MCIEGLVKAHSFRCVILVVYAPNTRSNRRLLWEDLLALRDLISVPMLAMGDFNEVFIANERKGGVGCTRSTEEFRHWATNVCFSDLDLHKRKFTNSSSRIDGMLAEAEWFMKFPNMKLKALPTKIFDHTPLVLEIGN